MKNQTIPLDYANSLIYDLEKAFWDERGEGARFRTTTVGNEYFVEKCLPLIKTSDLDDILETISGVLTSSNIAGKVSFNQEDRLLRVQVEGCIHRPVEDRMIEHGVEPFTCVPANIIALAVEEKLDCPVELAEIKIEDGVCHLLLVIFEHRPTLD
jgi:hypothetical protein